MAGGEHPDRRVRVAPPVVLSAIHRVRPGHADVRRPYRRPVDTVFSCCCVSSRLLPSFYIALYNVLNVHDCCGDL